MRLPEKFRPSLVQHRSPQPDKPFFRLDSDGWQLHLEMEKKPLSGRAMRSDQITDELMTSAQPSLP